MTLATLRHRWIATGLIATMAVLGWVPAAHANHYRRYKGVNGYSPAPQRVVLHEHYGSGAGPVLAGLVGGFILGTVVSNHEQVYVHGGSSCASRSYSSRDYGTCQYDRPARYAYYDPCCDEWFDSVDECRLHFRDRRHFRAIRVIDLSTGECVRSMHYSNGGWRRMGDEDWRDDSIRDRDWRDSRGWEARRDDNRQDDEDSDR